MENHLGSVSINLGKKISRMLESYHKKETKLDILKKFLTEIYTSDKKFLKNIDYLSDKELLKLLSTLEKGVPISTPVFDGATEDDIVQYLKLADTDTTGQVWLWSGETGERLERKVTVGCSYVLKLHHLVEEKIHARSTGPYSLVTQQPLGGKSSFGGQRFGEMEVWALEAYGAANLLQEMLTVKSDDVFGRVKLMSLLLEVNIIIYMVYLNLLMLW